MSWYFHESFISSSRRASGARLPDCIRCVQRRMQSGSLAPEARLDDEMNDSWKYHDLYPHHFRTQGINSQRTLMPLCPKVVGIQIVPPLDAAYAIWQSCSGVSLHISAKSCRACRLSMRTHCLCLMFTNPSIFTSWNYKIIY